MPTRRLFRPIATACLSWLALAASLPDLAAAEAGVATLEVDATEAPRNILHVAQTIPVRPGPLTLIYPKWLPGYHAPDGPINDLVTLRVTAGGAPLAWRRDPVEMYAFIVLVPPGIEQIKVTFDFIFAPTAGSGFDSASASARLAMINWNEVVLYPLGPRPDDIAVAASIRLPAGWKHATALDAVGNADGVVRFAPVSLTTLIDSPLLAGAHLRRHALTEPGDPAPVFLTLAADSEAALALSDDDLASYRHLVREARALFGSTHYRRYEFLHALSDHIAHYGLEHHESSDNRQPERSLIDEDLRRAGISLLPHEYSHSWCGKFRRPAGLATGDYSTPYRDELLWVYEGLNTYLDTLLTPRSGLYTLDDALAELAISAATHADQPGRAWRPLQDTTDAAPILYHARSDYAALRRTSGDFYTEGSLLWLEVDVTIRELTRGAKSLDDFARAFFGGPGGAPEVRPYTVDDIFAALGAVAPHDWRALLTERLSSVAALAPLQGIERAGWRLVFTDTPTDLFKSRETAYEQLDARFSLGLLIGAGDSDAGSLVDVIPGSVAARAGLAPGMRLIAVNGRRYSGDLLKVALQESVESRHPLELIAENREFISVHTLDYHDGERFPRLVRDPARPDLLTAILSPRLPRPASPIPHNVPAAK
ncbi:MAG: M61 family metallopeptidase [Opitutaceae bacterium]|nr:M61 family metallopeptidase [Opitutaceae bacterium]